MMRNSVLRISTLAIITILLLPGALSAADYLIGEGDTLLISVWGEKDLSLPVKVRPDGKITLPAAGEVTAAGITVKGLQTLLTDKIGKIVKNPVVTILVTEITNNKVYVFGGGVNSGVYSLTQRTTLLQLLCQMGQPQPTAVATPSVAAAAAANVRSADLKNAYVMRGGKKVKQDFRDLFVNGNIADDFVIETNDAIFIPGYADRNIYVMGAVNIPKSVEYRDGITVTEAILEAGGFTKFASPNDTVIYRKNGSKSTTIPVKMKKLINDGDLSQNERLLPGDYVIVKEGIF